METKGTYSVYFYSLIFLNISLDAVAVAKSITLKDKFENLGPRYVLTFLHVSHTNHPTPSLVKDVAQKTNEMAGDGTTTATVLARSIYSEGVKNVAAGCNAMDLRRGSQAAVDNVVQYLSAQTKTITTTAQVATISVNGDTTHVGNLIAQAMEKVGKEGVITVNEGRTIEDDRRHEIRPRFYLALLRNRCVGEEYKCFQRRCLLFSVWLS